MKHSSKLFLVALFLASACAHDFWSQTPEYAAIGEVDSAGRQQGEWEIDTLYYSGTGFTFEPINGKKFAAEYARGKYVNGLAEGKWLVATNNELTYHNGKLEGPVRIMTGCKHSKYDVGTRVYSTAQYKDGRMNGVLEGYNNCAPVKALMQNDQIAQVYSGDHIQDLVDYMRNEISRIDIEIANSRNYPKPHEK